jgi:phosphatidylinositol alpha-mannosyltransferase
LSGLRIIPNGVDVDEYQVGDKTAHSVVFLGRDDPRKGLDVLIEAWPAVHTVVPDATLTVVGADRGDQVDGVTYLGRVSEEDKRAALASSAVYAAPNTGGESFGIVVIEAMASGCAVIASAIPAFARVVGDAGELVKPGDPGGLADRIVTLLLEPERRVALGSLARERAWMFDGATVAASYLEAYADAISIHGR